MTFTPQIRPDKKTVCPLCRLARASPSAGSPTHVAGLERICSESPISYSDIRIVGIGRLITHAFTRFLALKFEYSV